MNETLFPAPQPEHPDAHVARQEISRYYSERADDARAALAEAQARLDARERELTAWNERGQISADVPAGAIDLTAVVIESVTTGRYLDAARAAIYQRPGDPAALEEAEQARQRSEALRRWLTAEGYDLGSRALPAPQDTRRRAGTRRRTR